MTTGRRSSLHGRLLTGMLLVTAAGLLFTGAVSGIVLAERLGRQRDDRLVEAINRPVSAARIAPPHGRWTMRDYPVPFVVVRYRPDGTTQVLSGDDPDPRRAVASIRRTGPAGLRPRAARGDPFDLGDQRAAARYAPNGSGEIIVVVARPDDVAGTVRNLMLAELVAGTVLLTLLGLGGRRLIRRGLTPLDRMASTAQRIATGGDLRARMDAGAPGTEVQRLGEAINVMLERIERLFADRVRSEERVRAFAADASHELRTPLTTIMGYTQLVRQGAVPPERRPDALRRIEAEARRMSSLVGELLELARLDRGAALCPAATDIAALVRDAVADARAVEPARTIISTAPYSLVGEVDETRIRQVLANLLANVRTHTPPTADAAVRLYRGGSDIVLEVADHGPGMAAEDAGRAFDRFHRTERGPDGGSGLGLAIVSAIAEAHGGHAELSSTLGEGTTVRVTLPTHQDS